MAATNYAAKANKEAEAAKDKLTAFERANGLLPASMLVEAQVHATLAVAYAELAVFTATGS